MSTTDLPYSIKKAALSGQLRVYFKCPSCKTEVHCPLNEAGDGQKCPECGQMFVVPGRKERASEDARAERERQAEAAKRAEELAREQAAVKQRMEHLAAQRAHEASIAARKVPGPRTWGMKVSGFLLGFVGLGMLLVSATMDTSTSASSSLGQFDRVHNIGLIADRELVALVGVGLVGIGCMLSGMAYIGDEIHRWGKRLTQQDETREPPI